jgi:NADH:ubiquinone oxidoreductase subunit
LVFRILNAQNLNVTGKKRLNLAVWDDTHLADNLGHMSQINPKCTLRKMSARPGCKVGWDKWHKAHTTDNSMLFI